MLSIFKKMFIRSTDEKKSVPEEDQLCPGKKETTDEIKPVSAEDQPCSGEKEITDEIKPVQKEDQFCLGEKEIFLLHYLHHRKIAWGIDKKVEELFADCSSVINQLYKSGYLEEDKHVFFLEEMRIDDLKTLAKESGLSVNGKKQDLISRIIDNTSEEERKKICPDLYYVLTPLGLSIDSEYVRTTREKNHRTKESVYNKVSSGDFVGATLEMAEANSKKVIPPGIGTDWSDQQRMSSRANANLERIKGIDFTDLKNSPQYKELLVKILYFSIDGENDLQEAVKTFIRGTTEKLQCAMLDSFFERNGFTPEEQVKVFVYLDAKRYNLFQETMKPYLKNGQYKPLHPGEYRVEEHTFKYWKEVDEYKTLSGKNIPGFPKTFRTYQKHKNDNSEKYKGWIEAASNL